MQEFGRINFATALYLAAILSLGVVLTETGAGALLASGLLGLMPFAPGADLANFLSLVLLGTTVNTATTAPDLPAVLGPMAPAIAEATGLPLKTVLMSLVIGCSTVLLPYQVPPLIIALRLGGVPIRQGATITLAIAVLTLAVLTPLNYLWWRLLGCFG